ncbi:MAG TPA: ABC transporter permease [Candidatus Acidoferrum sp.]|nr:ABC transporter permease [Candidatus Acidoferrum sp.]
MSVRTFLNDALAVTFNEFRLLRRNRTAIMISLVILPIFFTVSLGGASGGATEHFSPTAHLAVAYVDNDLTIASSRLLQTLASSGDFNDLVQGYSEENAIATLGTGRIYAAIIVPRGFQDHLANNETASIVVYVDDSLNGLGSDVVSNLQSSLRSFSPSAEAKPLLYRGPSQIEVIQKGAKFSSFNIGFTIILGLVIVFATFYEIAGGMSRESEEGTYARLLMSPMSLGAVILGKTMYDVALNLIRTFMVFALAFYAYGARPNTDFGTILTISLLIALLTMGFGFMISAFGVGVRAVIIIEFFLVLFLFAFSGFVIDRELLRGISSTISYLLPWAYGMEILKRTILIGSPLLSLTGQLGSVLASIAVFYGIAYVLLRLSRERLVT